MREDIVYLMVIIDYLSINPIFLLLLCSVHYSSTIKWYLGETWGRGTPIIGRQMFVVCRVYFFFFDFHTQLMWYTDLSTSTSRQRKMTMQRIEAENYWQCGAKSGNREQNKKMLKEKYGKRWLTDLETEQQQQQQRQEESIGESTTPHFDRLVGRKGDHDEGWIVANSSHGWIITTASKKNERTPTNETTKC